MDEKLKYYKEDLTKIFSELKKILSLSFNGFSTHDIKSLDEADCCLADLKKEIDAISKLLENSYFKDAKCKASSAVTVPAHLERILSNVTILVDATRKKINDSVLFSEKAVKGLDYLYKSSGELLKDISDAIRTKNETLARHIVSNSKVITNKAEEYATEHEERLIAGLCGMKASPIFLDILDSLKGIIWHASQIAQRV